jgi:hypothetical protein
VTDFVGEIFPGFLLGGLMTALIFRMVMMRLDPVNWKLP